MAILKNTDIQTTGFLKISSGPTIDRLETRTVIEQFTAVGTTSWTAPAGVSNIEVLVVAGGGGGGQRYAGGGGAGGLIYRNAFPVTAGSSYSVTVGGGGAGGTAGNGRIGQNGQNSVFGTLTAIGGGGGGELAISSARGYDGGSGGGVSIASTTPGQGTAGQGNRGGISGLTDNATNGNAAAGGGGAGGPGGNVIGAAARDWGSGGGPGLAFDISGTLQYYAGGGGGGTGNYATNGMRGGPGGIGGGGRGGASYLEGAELNGANGAANTGGGGGGGGGSNAISGGNGGSGIVIVRYIVPVTISPEGTIRYNTDLNDIEVYENLEWKCANTLKNFGGHNLTLFSEQFDNAYWGKARSTISLTNTTLTTAPDGSFTAEKLIEDSQTGPHHIFRNNVITYTAGVTYTNSVYAKAAERTRINMRLGNGAAFTQGNLNAVFDLSNGTIVNEETNVKAKIKDIGNGWYRCSVTSKAIVTTADSHFVLFLVQGSTTVTSYTGDNTSGVFVWGTQLEASDSPGPYTRTVSSVAPIPVKIEGYRIHSYTSVGQSSFTPAVSGFVEVLVVAGGGSGGGRGGNDGSGGGGAGGLIYQQKYPVISNKNYRVIVGAGGTGVAAATIGNSGQNSVFADLIAFGGGGGGTEGSSREGRPGGSGGGGGGYAIKNGGASVPGQGNDGGQCTGPGDGGGGGAGGPGANGRVGNGGQGLYFEQFNNRGNPPGWFAGGGGSSGDRRNTFRAGAGGLGGFGGGGNGQSADIGSSLPALYNGVANTGGGGGAPAGLSTTAGAGTNFTSGAGGSGIVLIRYQSD